MTIIVSRGTIAGPDGQRMCSRCERRPRVTGQRWCQECHADYCRQRRQGMIEMLLTPDERAKIQKGRQPRRPESRRRTARVTFRLLPVQRALLEELAAQYEIGISELVVAATFRFVKLMWPERYEELDRQGAGR